MHIFLLTPFCPGSKTLGSHQDVRASISLSENQALALGNLFPCQEWGVSFYYSTPGSIAQCFLCVLLSVVSIRFTAFQSKDQREERLSGDQEEVRLHLACAIVEIASDAYTIA